MKKYVFRNVIYFEESSLGISFNSEFSFLQYSLILAMEIISSSIHAVATDQLS